MDDIAKHLGVSKKTIYQFYKDKDDLVCVLSEKMLNCYMSSFEELGKSAKDAVDEILQLMTYLEKKIWQEMNPNMIYDMQKYHPRAWKKFNEFKQDCIMRMVEQNISTGVQQGLYRKDINPKVLAILRMEEVEMGMNPAVFPGDKFNIGEVQIVLLDHFLHGIVTIKGHRLINKYKQIIEEE